MHPNIRHTHNYIVSAVVCPFWMLSSQDNLCFISKPKNHCLCKHFVKAALKHRLHDAAHMCLVPLIMSDQLLDRRAICAPAGAVPRQQSASHARQDSGAHARRDGALHDRRDQRAFNGQSSEQSWRLFRNSVSASLL